ncbi:MAG TPA: CHASE2 domain-containing protein [Rhizomicrobium sp.]|nr:CHASE2 domain-containing protein [Rhizomicrobium sp.]
MTVAAETGTRRRDHLLRIIQRVRRPDRAQMEALSQRVPYWFVCVALFAFATIQIMLNPFGFSDLTQRYAQDISNLLVTGPYLYGDAGQKAVSAAIVDEDTLQTLQMPWPWSYGTHALVLDALLEYRPKAVVVDFLFVDTRSDSTLPQLVDEIARFKKAGVPLYFEGGTHLPYGEYPLRPELAKTGVRILDPTIPVYDGIARQYNVTGRCFGPQGRSKGSCYSLALEVFRDTYPQYRLEPLNGMMELVWGTRTDPHNAKWITSTDEGGQRKSCNQDIGPLRRFYLAFFDPGAVQNPCPYNAQIPVVSLIEGSEDPDIADLIRNRVVFYGGSLEGAQDITYTPVNGLLPSVFVHAMALDNLITFKGKPEQNVITVFGTTIPSNPAQMMAIVPVILILALIHMRRMRRNRARARIQEHSVTFEYVLDKTIETVWHYFAFALALGMGLVLALVMGLSTANWVEVVFVSVELAAMLLVGVPDSLWGYLHHVAGGVAQDPA